MASPIPMPKELPVSLSDLLLGDHMDTTALLRRYDEVRCVSCVP
jgi:hypothetical protein